MLQTKIVNVLVEADAMYILYSFFKKTSTKMLPFNTNQCNIDDEVANNFSDEILDSSNCEIKDEEILEAEITKLVVLIISSTVHIFLPVYRKLFNLVFDHGIVSDEWLIGTLYY
jgi:hypothetical protein